MKVYFACSSSDIQKHLTNYNLIREIIKKFKHTIAADWVERVFNAKKVDQISKREQTNIRDEGISAINFVDALIADISIPSSSVGFQVGLALSKKIPVLCLYSDEFGSKEVPQVINAINSPLLVISEYNSKSVGGIVKRFLRNLPKTKLIKFNFIITPQIAEYLDWGSKNSEVSKSDFLREKVEKIIEADSQYNS